ncbi:helix-turn-helix domain-containing protein [Mollicutes bacterium LVI A0078]|nr:helix-turn-helix domain-containing protein [Mollicutes bacterium LVI A0078]
MNQTNYNIETKITYTHLTLAERCIIEKVYSSGLSLSKIATKLGRSKSTIHYEITSRYRLLY